MRRTLGAILLLTLSLTVFSQVLDPVSWQWDHSGSGLEPGDEVELIFTLQTEPNWYVYANGFDPECGPNPTVFYFEENEGFELVGEPEARGAKKKFDEIFECDVVIFESEGSFVQRIKVLKSSPEIRGVLEFQTCNEISGLCLPPKEVEFEFGVEGDPPPVFDSGVPLIPQDGIQPRATESFEYENPAEGDLWAFIVIAFLSGLAALLTPCVFPMVPMTVTFFLKDDNGSSNGVRNGLIFGISIIAIYVILGTLVALIFGADSLNAMATHWFPNLFAFTVFFIFALSFLGMFEITLPSGIVNRVDRQSERGGMIGIFFMAFTLALVSFSCTFPIVGLVLALSAQGAFLKPILGMLSFSLALALPFTIFAIFPHWLKKLPRSGGWLNSVKVVLGFIELALGLKFLSVADLAYHWGILDREIYLAAWIVIFTFLGFYLLGKIRLPHDGPLDNITVPRAVLAIITFSFVVYLVPGMFGAPLKGLAGYLPPMHTMDRFLGEEESAGPLSELCEEPKFADKLHFPHGIRGYFDLDQALSCAKALKKPVFIDFTGHGCVNCRKMEEFVWSDPMVLDMLKTEFVMVALYVDDRTELPENEWYTSELDGKVKKTIGKQNADYQISRFNNNAQPFYIILDPDGNFLHGPRDYSPSVEEFSDFLKDGLSKYRGNKGIL